MKFALELFPNYAKRASWKKLFWEEVEAHQVWEEAEKPASKCTPQTTHEVISILYCTKSAPDRGRRTHP